MTNYASDHGYSIDGQLPGGGEDERPPYGLAEKRCTNAQPGTYGHECGKPASWIGTTGTGFRACFCEHCKVEGHEARDVVSWNPIA